MALSEKIKNNLDKKCAELKDFYSSVERKNLAISKEITNIRNKFVLLEYKKLHKKL